MASDFRVTGAEHMARAAAAIKAEGDAPARREMLRAIQSGTKELKGDIKASARSDLPRRGGLNEVIADSPLSTRSRTTGSSVGVRIVATGKPLRDIEAINRGRVRTRWGRTGPNAWQTQAVKPGYFTRPLEAGAPKVQRELLEAMHRVVANITRRSR